MYSTSAQYPAAVRAGGRTTVVCDAWYGGAILAGGADLGVTGGSVTDDSTPGVRRQLDVELQPSPGLYDLLAPIGTQIRARSVLRYTDGTTETVPLGVFIIDSVSRGYGTDGSVKVAGSDKWVLVQRAQFLIPYASTPGLPVVEQIITLVTDALGTGEPVIVNATSAALMGSQVWETDRDKAIMDLAESIGAYVYFDRNGVCTIDDLPALHDAAPAWSVDASATGVMLSAQRSADRSKTYNAVVVNSNAVDGTDAFAPVIVWDDDPASPTYAGTNPLTAPLSAGPFGIVAYHYSSPLVTTELQAYAAANTILARVTGLNKQMSLTAVRNHALDSLDVVQVLLPRERYDLPRAVEVHNIDKIVHPLMPDGTQSLETRSTRTDIV